MAGTGRLMRAIALAALGAILASILVMAFGGFLVGFDFTVWPEREGRIFGAAATILGIAGAAFGLYLALRR